MSKQCKACEELRAQGGATATTSDLTCEAHSEIARLRHRLMEAERNLGLQAKRTILAEAEVDRLTEQNGQKESPKTAPVQGYGHIPWGMHMRAWDVYAVKYGKYQSAERIAERGGLHYGELDEFIPGWRDELSVYAERDAAIARAGVAEQEVVRFRQAAYEYENRLENCEYVIRRIAAMNARSMAKDDPVHIARRALLSEGDADAE